MPIVKFSKEYPLLKKQIPCFAGYRDLFRPTSIPLQYHQIPKTLTIILFSSKLKTSVLKNKYQTQICHD